jgi:hypothetical protein
MGNCGRVVVDPIFNKIRDCHALRRALGWLSGLRTPIRGVSELAMNVVAALSNEETECCECLAQHFLA